MSTDSPDYFIGLAQWHHPDWYPLLNQEEILDTYSRHFSSVEGNSSFYGLPSEHSISAWKEQAHAGFRFCFKFPKNITHQKMLKHCDEDLSTFFNRISPLENKLGVLWLQMSNAFSAKHLDDFERFVESLPPDFQYGIEVRHLDFFGKTRVMLMTCFSTSGMNDCITISTTI